MMKRIISVMLSVVIVMSFVPAALAEKAKNADVTVDVQTVTVTVTTDKTGNLTGYIEKDGKVYGVSQTKAYEETEEGFTYQLSFVMPIDADHGTYTVCLGDVYHADVAFDFIGLKAMVGGFQALDQAEAEEIYELLTAEDSVLPYDTTKYVSLKEEVRKLVDAEIASWPMEATIDTVEEVASTYRKNMDEVMMRALLANADSADFEALAKKAIENKTFDGSFFDKVKAEVVRKYMAERKVTSISYDDLSCAFSESVLLAVAEKADYITLYDATVYYEEKGIVKFDTEALKKLEEDKLHYSVFKKMKDKTYQTVSLYEDELETVLEEYIEDADSGSSGGSSGGGGASGGGGSSSGGGVKGATSGAAVPQKPSEKPAAVSFGDIESVVWAKPAILYLAEQGVLAGRGEGVFAPNDTVTREEFVKMIVAAFSVKTDGAACDFEDVSAGRWSYPYIGTATELGLVYGVDETHFNPTGIITREDLAVILHRAYNLAGKEAEISVVSFADANDISGYAMDAVAALTGVGVINGMGDGTFAPKGTVTRAQAAKAIYELLQATGGVK
ncbi:MAG: S-layer homology domain-containing protein [Clostridia bacterium]|nr:S-layer homology domain-containing protein [Clostridia bacterium]